MGQNFPAVCKTSGSKTSGANSFEAGIALYIYRPAGTEIAIGSIERHQPRLNRDKGVPNWN
jgi:hypothetical protein